MSNVRVVMMLLGLRNAILAVVTTIILFAMMPFAFAGDVWELAKAKVRQHRQATGDEATE